MQTFKRAALRQVLEKREPALPAVSIRFHPGLLERRIIGLRRSLSVGMVRISRTYFGAAQNGAFFFSECCR